MSKKYKIRWLLNAIKFGKIGKRHISLGYCEKTEEVAFIAVHDPKCQISFETLKIIRVKDVYVNEHCENAFWCWCLDCEFNNANPNTLKKYVGKCTATRFKQVAEDLRQWGTQLLEEVDWKKDEIVGWEKPPIVIRLVRRTEPPL